MVGRRARRQLPQAPPEASTAPIAILIASSTTTGATQQVAAAAATEPEEPPSLAGAARQSPPPPRKQGPCQRVLPLSPDADTVAQAADIQPHPQLSSSGGTCATSYARAQPTRPPDACALPLGDPSAALHVPDTSPVARAISTFPAAGHCTLPVQQEDEVCSEQETDREAEAATAALVAEIEHLSRGMSRLSPEERPAATSPENERASVAFTLASSSTAVAALEQKVTSASAFSAGNTRPTEEQQQLDEIDLEIMRKEESLQRLEDLLEAEARAQPPAPVVRETGRLPGPWSDVQAGLSTPSPHELLQTTRWSAAGAALLCPLSFVPLHEYDGAPLSDRESTRSELLTGSARVDDAFDASPVAARTTHSGYHSADECFTASEYLQHKRQMHQWHANGTQWHTQTLPPPQLLLHESDYEYTYEQPLFAAAHVLYQPPPPVPMAMQPLRTPRMRSLQGTPMHTAAGALQQQHAALEPQHAIGSVDMWQLPHSSQHMMPAAASACYGHEAEGWLCGTCLHEVHQHGPGPGTRGEVLLGHTERALSPSSGQSCSSQAESGSRSRHKRMLLTRDPRYGSQSARAFRSPLVSSALPGC